MSVKERLIEALEPLGWPVYLQGSIPQGEAYPPAFVTFWASSVDGGNPYDDAPRSWSWDIDVFFYGTDPREVDGAPDRIIGALRTAGFMPFGKGFDLPSDEPTHTGWAMRFFYREEA